MVATLGLLVSTLLALLAFIARGYETAPKPEALIDLMHQGDQDWLKWRFLGNMVQALDTNRPMLDLKARLVTLSIVFLLSAASLVGGYLIYALIVGAGR